MKFTCDNCRAKYQIADEKVAGKTVRMKCRKCGALIQVRARQTEHGVEAIPVSGRPSGAPPAAEASASPGAPPAAAAASASGTSASAGARVAVSKPSVQIGGAVARAAPPRPGQRPGKGLGFGTPGGVVRPFSPSTPLKSTSRPLDEFDDEATVVMYRPSADAVRQALQRPLPAAGRPAAPRPAAGQPARAAAPASPAVAPAPASPAPISPPASAPSPPDPFRPSDPVVSSEPGRLAADSAPAPAPGGPSWAPSADSAEWYVGIDNKPVGPKPKSFLQEQLDAGVIDGSSLVWREDMADWKPLRTVEALSTLVSPTPRASARELAASSSKPISAPAPAAGEHLPAAALSDPLALVHVKPEGAGARAEAVLQPEAARPEAATTEAAAPLAMAETGLEADVAARKRKERRRRKRGISPIAWAFVAMAGAFGAVAAYVVFSAPPEGNGQSGGGGGSTETAPAAGGAAPSTSTVTRATIVLDPVNVEPGNGEGAGANGQTPSPKDTSSPGGDDFDRSGFGTNGPSGPSGGPGSSGGDPSHGELTTAEIQSTVNRNKGSVSRKCMPLVEAGSPSGATSARVTATLVVGPSGSVQSASASGGNEFPGLASCVAGRVRGWKFPASSGTTQVNVPFHFIAQ